LDIKGAGEETLKQLVKSGLAQTPADLFNVSIVSFCKLERQGSKGYLKFISGLEAKKGMTTAEFFAALDVEGVLTWEAIVKVPGLQTVGQVKEQAAKENWELFDKALRVSMEKAKKITDAINNRLREIEALESKVIIKEVGSKLIGMTFCITGTLSKPRREIEAQIKGEGGQVGSFTSRTTHLVTNESNSKSGKMRKAKEAGTSIITESSLQEMLVSEG